jgi:hypothetical protein
VTRTLVRAVLVGLLIGAVLWIATSVGPADGATLPPTKWMAEAEGERQVEHLPPRQQATGCTRGDYRPSRYERSDIGGE